MKIEKKLLREGKKRLRVILLAVMMILPFWGTMVVLGQSKKENNLILATELKDLTYYDAKIRANGRALELIEGQEVEVLKRELVARLGYKNIQEMTASDENIRKAILWLIEKPENLREFLMGGGAERNTKRILQGLGRLLIKHEADLDEMEVLSSGVVKGKLYKTMMIADAIAHGEGACFWAGGNQCSDPVERYELYKKMHQEGLLKNEVFEKLVVEEMRWVMDVKIDNKQLPWLNNYAWKKKIKWIENELAKPNITADKRSRLAAELEKVRKNKSEGDLNPYAYINYDHSFSYNYLEEQYYSVENRAKWQSKYGFDEFKIGYEEGKPKLWIVFEEGAVCGGISKTGENLNGAFGVPAAVIGQPGHAAYLIYSKTNQYEGVGNRGGKWSLGNDISGWNESEKGERLLLGWGPKRRLSDYAEYNVSYMLLGQANLNQFEKFEKVRKLMMVMGAYDVNNEAEKRAEIAEQALAIMPIDFAAWQELIMAYDRMTNKTESDYDLLARRIVNEMYKYPLPMVDLLKMIEKKLSPGKTEAYKQEGLERGVAISQVEGADSLQPGVTRTMANSLLGKTEKAVKFSFSGEQAGKIVLAEKFKTAGTGNGSSAVYEYSLDGKKTWKKVENEWAHDLTEEEIAQISEENDIVVYFVGATPGQCGNGCNSANEGEAGSRTPIHTIDIARHGRAKVFANDDENKVMGQQVKNGMEWKNEEGKWVEFSERMPDLKGDKSVVVRLKRSGNYLPGAEIELYFTEDEDNEKRKYVSIEGMKAVAVSSEQKGRDDKEHAIDGNQDTIWHTRWHGVDNERYIIVDAGRVLNLSGIDYWPRQDGAKNGIVKKARVSISENGVEFREIGVFDFENGEFDKGMAAKKMNFVPSVKAKYVKFEGLETVRGFMAVAKLNLFEDKTVVEQEEPGGGEQGDEGNEQGNDGEQSQNGEQGGNNQPGNSETEQNEGKVMEQNGDWEDESDKQKPQLEEKANNKGQVAEQGRNEKKGKEESLKNKNSVARAKGQKRELAIVNEGKEEEKKEILGEVKNEEKKKEEQKKEEIKKSETEQILNDEKKEQVEVCDFEHVWVPVVLTIVAGGLLVGGASWWWIGVRRRGGEGEA